MSSIQEVEVYDDDGGGDDDNDNDDNDDDGDDSYYCQHLYRCQCCCPGRAPPGQYFTSDLLPLPTFPALLVSPFLLPTWFSPPLWFMCYSFRLFFFLCTIPLCWHGWDEGTVWIHPILCLQAGDTGVRGLR